LTAYSVVVPGGIVKQRVFTTGHVAASGGIVRKRSDADSRVVISGSIGRQRRATDGRVEAPRCVTLQCTEADGRVLEPGGIVLQRARASVPSPIAVFPLRSLGAAKKPFMSIITSVVVGPSLNTLIPPLTVPAGTMAALDTIKP
jgi:hypothetical protein